MTTPWLPLSTLTTERHLSSAALCPGALHFSSQGYFYPPSCRLVSAERGAHWEKETRRVTLTEPLSLCLGQGLPRCPLPLLPGRVRSGKAHWCSAAGGEPHPRLYAPTRVSIWTLGPQTQTLSSRLGLPTTDISNNPALQTPTWFLYRWLLWFMIWLQGLTSWIQTSSSFPDIKYATTTGNLKTKQVDADLFTTLNKWLSELLSHFL